MTYGIRIFKQNSQLVYDSSSVTWNQVDSFLLAANTGLTQDYPQLQGLNKLALISLINSPPTTQRCISPVTGFSGNTLNITAGNVDSIITVLSQ